MRISKKLVSQDGSYKFLLRLSDERLVECFFVRLKYRDSICISSQVGCALKCAFCATGLDGLIRNLSAVEIADQVRSVLSELPPVSRDFEAAFMGMGEPLLNFDSVLAAMTLLEESIPGIIFRVSTVGIPEEMKRLAEIRPNTFLQLSLHAPTDAIRQHLIPIGGRYSVAEILNATRDYCEITQRNCFVNYTMLSGINDSRQCAEQLVKLLADMPVTLKLSKYNAIGELPWRPTSDDRLQEFEDICRNGGLRVFRHINAGTDVLGGCGTLRTDVNRRKHQKT